MMIEILHYSHRVLAYLIVRTIGVMVSAVFMDARPNRHRKAASIPLILAIIQIGVGAGVVESGLNFAATAFHLAIALTLLLVIGRIWAVEVTGEGESI